MAAIRRRLSQNPRARGMQRTGRREGTWAATVAGVLLGMLCATALLCTQDVNE